MHFTWWLHESCSIQQRDTAISPTWRAAIIWKPVAAMPADRVAGWEGDVRELRGEIATSWVELGQPPSCLLNHCSGQMATTGDGPPTEALGDTRKLPSLTCHTLVSHLTTSFPSLSRTDDHGSPVWFWHASIRFRTNDKRGLDHQRQCKLGLDSPRPLYLHLCRKKPSNLKFGSPHSALQPQHTLPSGTVLRTAGTAQPSSPEAAAGCRISHLLQDLPVLLTGLCSQLPSQQKTQASQM